MVRKKRLIVFPSWISTPHYETDLEIAINHAQRGWDVYVAHCRGELNSCMTNREQDPRVCLTCSSRISQGLAIALLETRKYDEAIIVCDQALITFGAAVLPLQIKGDAMLALRFIAVTMIVSGIAIIYLT